MKNSDKVVLVLLRASTRTVLYEIIAVPGYLLLQAQRHTVSPQTSVERVLVQVKRKTDQFWNVPNVLFETSSTVFSLDIGLCLDINWICSFNRFSQGYTPEVWSLNKNTATYGAPSLVTEDEGEASGLYLGAGDVAARGSVEPRGAPASPASDAREPSDDAFAATL